MLSEKAEKYYYKTLRIRRVEETLLNLFGEGKIFGTTHTSIGQEAIAVSIMEFIKDNDVVFSNHRCHGHLLSYGAPLDDFIAEVMGKTTGFCSGRGGSQHLYYKNFYTNGIQGGIVGNATGAAFAEKQKKTGAVVVVFLGDGTLGQGLVYESLNFASLMDLPILYVVENNQYAMSTNVATGVSGKIGDRAKAFNIKNSEITSNNVFELEKEFEKAFSYIRSEQKPFFQVVNTYRLAPHSKGDDYRDINEINEWKRKDPLTYFESVDDEFKSDSLNKIDDEIQHSIEKADSEDYEKLVESINDKSIEWENSDKQNSLFFNYDKSIVVKELNSAFDSLLKQHKDLVILGEDVEDPYGGAFKVTKGLSIKYNSQVKNTPISEAGLIAIGTGMAMRGLKPIIEIMFGDFLTLGADQIINHASKYHWMYNHKVNVPLIIRTPMGGRRGYGPTHSQSIEKFFIGHPYLDVIAISNLHNNKEIVNNLFKDRKYPALLIENKTLYGQYQYVNESGLIDGFYAKASKNSFPTIHLSLANFEKPDVTIITYGGMTPIVMEAAKKMFIDEEIIVDVVVVSQISPLPLDEIIETVKYSEVIVTAEEGIGENGWGTMVVSKIVQENKSNEKKFGIVSSKFSPIPNSKVFESQILPDVTDIINKINEVLI